MNSYEAELLKCKEKLNEMDFYKARVEVCCKHIDNMTFCNSGNLNMLLTSIVVLLASASKKYIGSVLFRASAFTGAKLASGVPAVIGCFGP